MGKISFKYSASAIGLYDYCPRKFKYQYIDKLESSSFPQCCLDGIFLHKCFEKYYNALPEEDKITPQVLNDTLNVIPPEAHNNFTEHITNFLEFNQRIFSHKTDNNCLKPLSTEEKLYDKELNLVGVLDSVFTDGTNFLIIDFKTGKPKTYIPKNYKFQLCIYAHLWNLFYPEQKITHWGLLYTQNKISDKNPIIEEVNYDDMEKMYEKLEDIKRKVEAQEFGKCSNDWNCKKCDYAKYCFKIEGLEYA